MPQVGSRTGRISILGLWQPDVSFEYALVQGGFKTERYIEVINWAASKAAQTLAETDRITVVVHDNGSLPVNFHAINGISGNLRDCLSSSYQPIVLK
ncbi:MAG: hypothetical protein V7K40_33380 [Nostoc sp.]|uniref:hypothetical protein n=1 Tax=Nostoc sp. TaxID=1180 RepID=UPI002FF5BCAF